MGNMSGNAIEDSRVACHLPSVGAYSPRNKNLWMLSELHGIPTRYMLVNLDGLKLLSLRLRHSASL